MYYIDFIPCAVKYILCDSFLNFLFSIGVILSLS